MKVPILSGNVSKRETIEALTESARTGKLSGNTILDHTLILIVIKNRKSIINSF